MQVRHKVTQREVTLKAGDVVEAVGPTKSATVGRVIDIDRSNPTTDKAIVFWFGVGCGSGWLASDLLVLQTAEEYQALVGLGAERFFAQHKPARDADFTRDEKVAIFEIAKDLRVRHVELMRAVRERQS